MAKIIDRETIDFLLFDVLDVEDLCGRGRFADHDRESLSAVLDLAERIAEAVLGKFGADAVTVSVRKPKPIAGVLDHAGVRITRTREDAGS